MKLAEILDGPDKWCQGQMRKGDQVCLTGALARMLDCDPDDPDILGSNSRVLDEALRMWGLIDHAEQQACHTLIGWNDAPARTFDQVAALVDAYDRDRMLNP